MLSHFGRGRLKNLSICTKKGGARLKFILEVNPRYTFPKHKKVPLVWKVLSAKWIVVELTPCVRAWLLETLTVDRGKLDVCSTLEPGLRIFDEQPHFRFPPYTKITQYLCEFGAI